MNDFRASARAGLAHLLTCPEGALSAVARDVLAEDAVFDVSAPVERLEGVDAILTGFVLPLRAALTGAHRRDLIYLGGQNIRAEGGNWHASVTHYVGNFNAALWGLAPSRHLAFVRSGEFYRINEAGRITQARIIVDLIDLMRQALRFPLPRELGTEIQFPAPATQDGLCPAHGNGPASLDVVEGMLSDLHAYDPTTFQSKDQTGAGGYWAPDMMWYGPGGIGSNFLWDGFVQDHRAAFLRAFPDRKGGNHYCRIGDGDYAAVSGWPSMTMTFQGDYLGVKADGRALTLRVMDFYRCAGGKIAENWVLLDYVELLAQMGVDVIARANALAPQTQSHRTAP